MGEVSARMGLPLLAAGQAGKETTHNEALALLDLCLGAVVEAVGAQAPPADPVEGRAWILGAAPTGAWAGHAHALAGWTAGGWRFVQPFEGLAAWSKAAGLPVRYAGGAWVAGELRASRVLVDGSPVLGPRRPAIASPLGGAVVDAEARAALEAALRALRDHGLIAA